jgi:ribonucleoside-diphosphate reductase alpha chain
LERSVADPLVRHQIVQQVLSNGSCQHVADAPAEVRETFVVAGDLAIEEHIGMQAALQVFVDNSISKTINAPATTTVEEIEKAYMRGWELGCKGMTVYVTGSREKVVLETKQTARSREVQGEPLTLWPEPKKPRPQVLTGRTYRVGTPIGTAYITVNESGDGNPFEVFIHTTKAGSEAYAVSEATGRLLSYILRLTSPVEPRKRLGEVIRQLSGIGGAHSMGFGPNRVLSLPDGIARALDDYLNESNRDDMVQSDIGLGDAAKPLQMPLAIGDLCPECGQAAVVNEEGCRKCYDCGFSEC